MKTKKLNFLSLLVLSILFVLGVSKFLFDNYSYLKITINTNNLQTQAILNMIDFNNKNKNFYPDKIEIFKSKKVFYFKLNFRKHRKTNKILLKLANVNKNDTFQISNIKYQISNINLDLLDSSKNNIIKISTNGENPEIQILKNNFQLSKYPIMFILLFFILIYKMKIVKKIIFLLRNIKNYFYKKKLLKVSILYLFISIISLYLFIFFIEIYFNNTSISIVDFFLIDLVIAAFLSIFGYVIYYIFEKKWKNLSSIIYFIFTVLLFSLGTFYLLSAYVFLEWGAFLEPQHIEALQKHGGKEEIISILLSLKTFLFLLSIFSIVMISYYISKKYNYKNNYKLILVTLLYIIFTIFKFNFFTTKEYTESPLLMISKDIDNNSLYVDKEWLKDINTIDFLPYKNVENKNKQYFSSAKNMNVVFFIMESVRQKQLSLYGYERETMPFLASLKQNMMIFKNGYVNQPRSCKTMESITLGIYPDPRLPSLTWKYKELINTSSVFSFLSKDHYTFYYGNMQENYGGESFDKYLKKLTSISGKDIFMKDSDSYLKHNFRNRTPIDERLLTDNFLQWSEKQNEKFMAILWSKNAHMPYNANIKKWNEDTLYDKYDNCLFNIDLSLKNLVTGLKKQNKLDNTLIVILGDHGEALGDKMDFGHGSFLYDHSIKIPVVFYNTKIFKKTHFNNNRFQVKDISATVLHMLGKEKILNQSVNIFSKSKDDKIYMTNVYQDFKLGLIYDNYKFIFRPKYNKSYLYDLTKKGDDQNIIFTLEKKDIDKLKREVLMYYTYQVSYVDNLVSSKLLEKGK